MHTVHQYLQQYPIHKQAKKLILGTIHPHNTNTFQIPFFYGNVLSLWRILNEASNGGIGNPITLQGILSFLEEHQITISDTIIACERKTETALDNDLIPTILNHALVNDISNSTIEEIFCTSGFQKNSAFKLFYTDILGLPITTQIRQQRSTILPAHILGHSIKLTILYSPSGAANRAIAQTNAYIKAKHLFQESNRPVHDFKVKYYREAFNL